MHKNKNILKKLWLVTIVLCVGILLARPSYATVTALTTKDCAAMYATGVISKNNPVQCERLRRVSFQYIDFTGASGKIGNVVVLDACAKYVQHIFDTLFHRRFPLAKALPMEAYRGDDNAAMRDNNTSGFNGRALTVGNSWSLHAYGAAIDINPKQNPFVSFDKAERVTVTPAGSAHLFLNRYSDRPGKLHRKGMAEDVIDIFAENGFISWGGYWDSPIDYQHFEIGSRALALQLAAATPEHAQQLFEQHVNAYRLCMQQNATQVRATARAACITSLNL